ncbi:unnamed protein product [Polarella glacialis]|uniref:EF-hand domain-containing protein n=1 Tax=Polarella glacialis TaxID=89957 RepID=A0A813KYC1_POLGL|nr:unnamed protein product [Polarella glacialis]CAE8714990.1 unnamed protein product [Polarella glacialis]
MENDHRAAAFTSLLSDLSAEHFQQIRSLQALTEKLQLDNLRLQDKLLCMSSTSDGHGFSEADGIPSAAKADTATATRATPPATGTTEAPAPESCGDDLLPRAAFTASPMADGNGREEEATPDEFLEFSDARRLSERFSALVKENDQVEQEEAAEATLFKPRLASMANFFLSGRYEVAIAILVSLNVVCMAVQMQYEGMDVAYKLVYKAPTGFTPVPARHNWPYAKEVLDAADYTFTALFIIDLLLRILILQGPFFKVAMNWIDIFVVGASIVEFFTSKFSVNPAVVRLFRFVRVGRSLRMIRTSKVLDSLQLILKCITSSGSILFWSLCVFFVVQCIAGMLISMLVKEFLMDTSRSVEARIQVFRYYGTFSRTILTMFEVLFANWAPACRVLTDNVSEWFGLVFIIYRCLVGFAILNVVNAVFVQSTMKVAAQDDDLMIIMKEKEQRALSQKLKFIFTELDTSADGRITFEELSALEHHPKLRTWLSTLEIQTHDLNDLYAMLNAGNDAEGVQLDEFLHVASRLKGNARSLDMALMFSRIKQLDDKVSRLSVQLPGESLLQMSVDPSGEPRRRNAVYWNLEDRISI